MLRLLPRIRAYPSSQGILRGLSFSRCLELVPSEQLATTSTVCRHHTQVDPKANLDCSYAHHALQMSNARPGCVYLLTALSPRWCTDSDLLTFSRSPAAPAALSQYGTGLKFACLLQAWYMAPR
jgi:hypothetical protein